MTQSPLQEAIEKLESLKETIKTSLISKDQMAWALSANESAIQHLRLMLPKEREFVRKTFEAGVNYMFEETGPNLQDYLNQLYPEK